LGYGASETKVVAFICSHCSLSGADAAGVKRLPYPSNVRLIRLTCSGQVNELVVLEALMDGADGVLVFGCPENDCHYKIGSRNAKLCVEKLKSMLPSVGLEPERVGFEHIGASDGEKFAEALRSMVSKIQELGPNPLKR